MKSKLNLIGCVNSLSSLLNQIEFYINNNSETIRKSDLQYEFFLLHLRFEGLVESLSYQYNMHDFKSAIQIVKKSGVVSIANISRSLNLRYKQSFEIVLEMEKQGIISKPNEIGVRKLIK